MCGFYACDNFVIDVIRSNTHRVFLVQVPAIDSVVSSWKPHLFSTVICVSTVRDANCFQALC